MDDQSTGSFKLVNFSSEYCSIFYFYGRVAKNNLFDSEADKTLVYILPYLRQRSVHFRRFDGLRLVKFLRFIHLDYRRRIEIDFQHSFL